MLISQIIILPCKKKTYLLSHTVRQGTRIVHAKELQSATSNENDDASAASAKMS